MKKTLVWILVAANVALGGTLAWRGIGNNTASAQATPPPTRGKYVLIPGEASSSSSIIYIFDSANGRVGAMSPDGKDVLVSMPTIQLKPIFDKALEAPAAGNNNRNNTTGNGNNPRPGGKPR